MPVGISHICSSLTTWDGINPSYCVYEIDAETFVPISKKVYAYDVTTANANGEPEWLLWTDWLSDYHLENLSPLNL